MRVIAWIWRALFGPKPPEEPYPLPGRECSGAAVLLAISLLAVGCCPGREAAVEVVREARVLLKRPVAGASPEWEAARQTFLADAAKVAPEEEAKK